MVSNCFLVLYGGEKAKLYSVMATDRDKSTGRLSFPDITPDMCLMWYDNWHSTHPETGAFHAACHAEYQATGHVRIPFGDQRARFFLGGVSKKNAIPNMKIQGSAAWMANDAMLQISRAIPFESWSPFTGLCVQVHDDIKVYAPKERAKEAEDILNQIMNRNYGGVPMPAKAVSSYRWSEQDQ